MSKRTDYPLFNHWIKTLDWLMELCARLPKYIRPILIERILGHSLDIAELLTQAIYSKERIPILRQVNQKLALLRILMRICHRRKWLSTRQYHFISQEIDTAGRMLGGWLKQSL